MIIKYFIYLNTFPFLCDKKVQKIRKGEKKEENKKGGGEMKALI